ncbi:hypothetical protein D0C16_00295 [Cellvibrio sp. KY-GH-1]|uniref:hypothetical protein n=1 Tax=Cellvibrio sp. KY-GH-1 TaxID=2303332 RepID=UPI001246A744|nr:hypothetical protein [Cellvibrio sp. KY-GH-1]QEY14554.1 hypothetical protein D0C16_00295 [Cellvibrio sp. KY-GH-1]
MITRKNQPQCLSLLSSLIGAAVLGFSSIAAAVNCDGVPQWVNTQSFSTSQQVVENHILYQAKWWNQNERPSINSQQDWQPWTRLGECVTIDISKELMIRDLSVVDSVHAKTGQLSIQHLIAQMMPQANPTLQQQSDFIQQWLGQFLVNTGVNGDIAPARESFERLFLQPWRDRSVGSGVNLNPAIAPFRLLSIVYRPDLHKRDVSGTVISGGEVRFVYGFINGNAVFPANVIFEYGLQANSDAQLNAWVDEFHALSKIPFGENYNTALLTLLNKVTSKGAVASKPNGSALNQVRTNEIPFGHDWELREFKLNSATGQLRQVTVAQTPAKRHNRTAFLADYINANEADILLGDHQIPNVVNGEAFAGAASLADFGPFTVWEAPGINNLEARHKFSLNTCAGCHAGETQTVFRHVFGRAEGQVADLSGFLTGMQMNDPKSGVQRQFNDLEKRKIVLTCLVQRCAASTTTMARAAGLSSSDAGLSMSQSAETSDLATQFQQIMEERRNLTH